MGRLAAYTLTDCTRASEAFVAREASMGTASIPT
jgi:hypothetical protein